MGYSFECYLLHRLLILTFATCTVKKKTNDKQHCSLNAKGILKIVLNSVAKFCVQVNGCNMIHRHSPSIMTHVQFAQLMNVLVTRQASLGVHSSMQTSITSSSTDCI